MPPGPSEAAAENSGLARAVVAVGLLSIAELFGTSVWFASAAVAGSIASHWHLAAAGRAWLTMAVQLGFVAGTLFVSVSNLADLMRSHHLFAVSAFLGALANAAPLIFAPAAALFISRFLTGFCLAGVYPIALKITATWFKRGRGLAMGWLVGSLTIGSASPHLLRGILGPNWQAVLLATSALAVAGGILVASLVGEGPYEFPRYRFRWRRALDALSRPGVALAVMGYMGHMWELYAMWTWVPVFLGQALRGSGLNAPVVSFWVIAVGAVGCLLGGVVADRAGRTTATIGAMLTSATCALLAGLAAEVSVGLTLLVAVVWGISVIADSAQFSACVTELAAPDEVGTALTVQNCVGFLLTMASIRLVPVVQSGSGWTTAFTMLAVGPLLGSLAMWRLRMLPVARVALAQGRG